MRDLALPVKEEAGFSATGKYATPSLALNLGHSLNKCCLIVKAEAIKSYNEDLRRKTKICAELSPIRWSEKNVKGSLDNLGDKEMEQAECSTTH